MSGIKIRVCDLLKKLLMLRRRLFLGITSIFLIVNVSAIASFSQDSQGKDLLLRSAIKSSLGEFYKTGDPISLFYFERNYEPFWIEKRKRLESLSRSLSEAGSHGLPLYVIPWTKWSNIWRRSNPESEARVNGNRGLLAVRSRYLSGILKPNMIDANINVDPQREKRVNY